MWEQKYEGRDDLWAPALAARHPSLQIRVLCRGGGRCRRPVCERKPAREEPALPGDQQLPDFSPKLPFSLFDRLPLPSLFIVSPAATGRRLQSCEFSGTESGVTQKLPVTTVGEQKPKAESVFKTTSTLIQYLSLVTVIVDMEGRGDGE